MTSRWPILTDDLLRRALTEEPPPALVDEVFDGLSRALEVTPQRRRAVRWPWSSGLPGIGSASTSRGLQTVSLLGVVALLLALAIATIAFVGSLLRPPSPFGRAGLIAFDSGGDIFVANADGSDRRQLTSGTEADVQPVFSPDGRRLAFEALDVATAMVSLRIVDVDGGHPTLVTTFPAQARASGAKVGWFHVSWSPDSGRLAYTAPENGAQQIYVVNADGTDPHRVGDVNVEGHDASWSPDGTMLAFVGGHYNDARGIYVMNADGTNVRVMRPGKERWGFDFGPPVWSPDARRLAFDARLDNASQVFVVEIDDPQPLDLSNSESFEDWGPAWSPDGGQLAWHRGAAPGEGRFVVAAADGSGPSVLPPPVVGAPAWSADGSKLVGYGIDADTGGRNRLVVVDVAHGTAIAIPAVPEGDASWQGASP